MNDTHVDDVEAIGRLMAELFEAISWSPESPPDWQRFSQPCLDDLLMVPAARPAKTTALQPFMEMMQKQRDDGNLVNFNERTLGHHVRVFGNIAIAMCGFETRINDGDPQRGVNAFMLVKSEGSWRIAAMSWDNETDSRRLPDYLGE